MSSDAACSSCSGWFSRMETSWYIVLMICFWMPVRMYSSFSDMSLYRISSMPAVR